MSERAANYLAGTSVFTGFSMSLVDLNVYLETTTLLLGITAGVFAAGFQIRRWFKRNDQP